MVSIEAVYIRFEIHKDFASSVFPISKVSWQPNIKNSFHFGF